MPNMNQYAFVTLKSKGVRERCKQQKLIYDPELALAFCGAAESVGSRMNAIAFYVSMHQCAFVYDLSRHKGGGFANPWRASVFCASLFSGEFFRRAIGFPVSDFDVQIFNEITKIEVVNKIKSISSTIERTSLVLAVVKQGDAQTNGVSNEELKAGLLEKGIVYDEFPEIFKRGICLTFDNSGNKTHTIISREPHFCFQESLNRHEAQPHSLLAGAAK